MHVQRAAEVQAGRPQDHVSAVRLQATHQDIAGRGVAGLGLWYHVHDRVSDDDLVWGYQELQQGDVRLIYIVIKNINFLL